MASMITQAQILLGMMDLAEVFLANDRETVYATVTVSGHRETYPVRSNPFRRWLRLQFYAIEHKPPGGQAQEEALGVIEAQAQSEGTVQPVYVRVAEADGDIWIDIGDANWRAIHISPVGWRVVDSSPVKFRRAKGMLPLPCPVTGGSLAELEPFLNSGDAEASSLLVAWLIAAFRPRGPYPVLVLGGEHGSAKSTTTKVLRRLIDPNSSELRSQPRDARDLMIAAHNSWILAFDNVSSL